MFYILNFYTLHYFYSSSMIYVSTMMLVAFVHSPFGLGISHHNYCRFHNWIRCFSFFSRSARIFRLLIVFFLFFRSFIKQALFLFATFCASFSEMWTPLEKLLEIKVVVEMHTVIFWMESQISEDEVFADLLTFFSAISFFQLLHSILKS